MGFPVQKSLTVNSKLENSNFRLHEKRPKNIGPSLYYIPFVIRLCLQPAVELAELTQAPNTGRSDLPWSDLSIAFNCGSGRVIELAYDANIYKPLEINGIRNRGAV